MDAIDAAVAHWREQVLEKRLELEVPEWPNDDGSPRVIYFTNLFNAEEEMRLSQALDKEGDLGFCIEALMVHALREDGRRMFPETARKQLRTATVPAVIKRVAARMVSMMTNPPTMDEALGN